MITQTVGTAGDYATWKAAWNALVAIVSLADDYQLRQISDITEEIGGAAWGVKDDMNNKTVTFLCPAANSHKGVPADGYKTTIPFGSKTIYLSIYGEPSDGGTVVIDGLNIINQNNSQAITVVNRVDYNQKHIVKDFIINGEDVADNSGLGYLQSNTAVEVYNGKIFDCGGIGLGHTGGTLVPADNGVVKTIENVTVYNCGTNATSATRRFGVANAIEAYKQIAYRNVVVCHDKGTPIDWSLYQPGTALDIKTYNCADSDGSLSNASNADPQNNIVVADEFESLVDLNSRFLFLNDGTFDVGGKAVPERGNVPLKVQFTDQTDYRFPDGVLAVNGTAPTIEGHDTDIGDLAVPSTEGFYSIGCHQAQII